MYAAQTRPQIDAAMTKKDRFRRSTDTFLIRKDAIFCQIKEIKNLRGGVVLYAAQANAQIDAELVKKGAFRAETNYSIIMDLRI